MKIDADDVVANKIDWSLDVGDCRKWSMHLIPNSVHCWITSPPYFSLRDYATGNWEGGDPKCDHVADPSKTKVFGNPEFNKNAPSRQQTKTKGYYYSGVCGKCGATRGDDQIGLEDSLDDYIDNLVEVFRGVRRATHPSGVLWLNLGDTYASGEIGRHDRSEGYDGEFARPKTQGQRQRKAFKTGVKKKDLCGVPWRVAFALQEDGWYLRQWMPWVKRNSMPESSEDRPSTACEVIFLLTKSPDYFFDMESVRRRAIPTRTVITERAMSGRSASGRGIKPSGNAIPGSVMETNDARNFRSADLWFDSVGLLMEEGQLLGLDVPVRPNPRAHFASFPERLVKPLIRCGSSEKGVCPHCGAPWRRVVDKERVATRPGTNTKIPDGATALDVGNRDPERHVTRSTTVTWEPTCDCADNDPIPSIVGDPFTGSGTVLQIARQFRRRAVGCELNPQYVEIARKRVANDIPHLF